MRSPTRYNWIGTGMTIGGFLIIGFSASWWAASWWVAGGIYLMITGSAIDAASDKLEIQRLTNKLFKDIEKKQ